MQKVTVVSDTRWLRSDPNGVWAGHGLCVKGHTGCCRSGTTRCAYSRSVRRSCSAAARARRRWAASPRRPSPCCTSTIRRTRKLVETVTSWGKRGRHAPLPHWRPQGAGRRCRPSTTSRLSNPVGQKIGTGTHPGDLAMRIWPGTSLAPRTPPPHRAARGCAQRGTGPWRTPSPR